MVSEGGRATAELAGAVVFGCEGTTAAGGAGALGGGGVGMDGDDDISCAEVVAVLAAGAGRG